MVWSDAFGKLCRKQAHHLRVGAAGIMSRQYADLYTWSHPYGEFAICHQDGASSVSIAWDGFDAEMLTTGENATKWTELYTCLLYTSDAADDLLCVDLGGRRIIKKKKKR